MNTSALGRATIAVVAVVEAGAAFVSNSTFLFAYVP